MTDNSKDPLIIGGVELGCRLFTGTGKYGDDALIPDIIAASGCEVVTVALRRVDLGNPNDNILSHIPAGVRLLPNTSGARDADEAVRIARLARAAGCGDWIKIEVISDSRHLLPDGYATARATEILAKEGFTVLPYINADLYVARDLVNAGASAVMPLGAPIGSNRGLKAREMIRILIEEIDLPIIVDAGLGAPSHACEAMEMGRGGLSGEHGRCYGERSRSHGTGLCRRSKSRARRLPRRNRARSERRSGRLLLLLPVFFDA